MYNKIQKKKQWYESLFENYGRTKDALLRMSRKIFQYEDEEELQAIPLILLPRVKKIRKHSKIQATREYI